MFKPNRAAPSGSWLRRSSAQQKRTLQRWSAPRSARRRSFCPTVRRCHVASGTRCHSVGPPPVTDGPARTVERASAHTRYCMSRLLCRAPEKGTRTRRPDGDSPRAYRKDLTGFAACAPTRRDAMGGILSRVPGADSCDRRTYILRDPCEVFAVPASTVSGYVVPLEQIDSAPYPRSRRSPYACTIGYTRAAS